MKEEERPVVCACSLAALNHLRAAHVAHGWLLCWSCVQLMSLGLVFLKFQILCFCISVSASTNCIIIKVRCLHNKVAIPELLRGLGAPAPRSRSIGDDGAPGAPTPESPVELSSRVNLPQAKFLRRLLTM